MSILHNIFFFIVAIGVLVAFHEYGHYWVARRLGVKVLRFSIGFGRPLFTWVRIRGEDSIEYVIAAFPIGGYVKMLDERESEVTESERARAFNNQPLLARTAIVAAGPIFNFILAVILYWIVFVSGVTVDKPLLGEAPADSVAYIAGFQERDVITRVGDKDINSWSQFKLAIIDQGLDGGQLIIEVMDDNRLASKRTLDLDGMRLLDNDGDVIDRLGFKHWWPQLPPELGGVTEDGVAESAGLQAGDRIIAIGNEAIEQWQQVVDIVRRNPGNVLDILIIREQQQLAITVIPAVLENNGEKMGYIGAYQHIPDSVKSELLVDIRHGPMLSVIMAIEKTWDMSILTLRVLWKIITGEAALSNISGPITIAQYAGITAGIGLSNFIDFLAIISVSLGVLNLLPIPMLDGGHLLYYLIESVKGTPVSEAFEAIGQQLGVVLLGALMFIALFNDFQRLLQ